MSNVDPLATLVRLNNARLSFPYLASPRPAKLQTDGTTSKPKYEASFLLSPSSPDYQAFLQRVMVLLTEKYKEHAQAAFQKFMGDRKTRCFGAGEEVVDKTTFQVLSGYPGVVYINGKSEVDRQPKLYGLDGNPMMDARALYGGCYVNAYVQPWIQVQNGGGIRCEVIAVQFAADGEAFGAAPIDTSGLFQPIAGAPAPIAPTFGVPGFQQAPPQFGAPATQATPAPVFTPPGVPGPYGF